MNLIRPLDSVLGSQAKVRVLRTLHRAGRSLAGREIGRRAEVGSGHVSRVLRELTALGVLDHERHGAVDLYSLRRDDQPIINEIAGLFDAEEQRLARIARQVADCSEDILAVILFGSEVRGTAGPESDTDLLVVARPRRKALVEGVLTSAMPAIGERELTAVSWLVASLDDIARWEGETNALWGNVRSEGRSLSGLSVEEVRQLCLTGATD